MQQWLQHKRQHDGAAPITWTEFKAFLQKNLRDSQAFVNSIWSKLKRDFQYQLEEVQDWAAHLEYLQSILLKFDNSRAPEESYLICFFREGLMPSIRAQIEQRGYELDSWTEIVEKAVDAEAQASLQPISYIKDIDQQCLRGSRPNSTKASTQGNSIKNPKVDKPKAWPQEVQPQQQQQQQQQQQGEATNRPQKKKGRQFCQKQCRGSISATGVNAAQPGKPKKKNNDKICSDRTARDLSQVKCYNYQKIRHYSRKCPKSKN